MVCVDGSPSSVDERSPIQMDGQYECKLVEVKGPRDRLFDKQRAWLQVLSNSGLKVEVCRVVEGQEKLKYANKLSQL